MATRAHLLLQLPEGHDLLASGHGAVVEDGRLLPATALHVTVHRIVAHIELPADEPAGEDRRSGTLEQRAASLWPQIHLLMQDSFLIIIIYFYHHYLQLSTTPSNTELFHI